MTLNNWNIVTDILSMRTIKFMGVAQGPSEKWFHVRLDVEFVTENEWGSSLLYFTGSKANNINMRLKAKRRGLTLNQHGLFSGSKKLPVFTEKEIYEELGMRYLEPHER